MDINIRKSVIDNITGSSQEEINHTINDAIKLGNETILPGLGVILELFWLNSAEASKNTFTSIVESALKK